MAAKATGRLKSFEMFKPYTERNYKEIESRAFQGAAAGRALRGAMQGELMFSLKDAPTAIEVMQMMGLAKALQLHHVRWVTYNHAPDELSTSFAMVALACFPAITPEAVIARGVAICSNEDPFVYSEGSRIAKRRAMRAIKGRHVEPIRRPGVLNKASRYRFPFTEKACINPQLTPREIMIIRQARTRERLAERDATACVAEPPEELKKQEIEMP